MDIYKFQVHDESNEEDSSSHSEEQGIPRNPFRDFRQTVGELSKASDSDIFLLSGPIDRGIAEQFFQTCNQAYPRRKNVHLILTTHGGDADAAYKIARFLKRSYQDFTLVVFGMCKSAGTILALGADEIVMSEHRGELGPLDVQILREDDLMQRSSGLDVFKAIKSIRDQSFYLFEDILLDLQRKSGGFITTKTASDIATSMAIGLMSPITSQLDPMRIGEIQRSITIAFEYGIRLNADRDVLNKLIHQYPSHSFVIDFDEARDLFGERNVRAPNRLELMLEEMLVRLITSSEGQDYIRHPHGKGYMAYLDPTIDIQDDHEPEDNEKPPQSTSDDEPGKGIDTADSEDADGKPTAGEVEKS